MTLSHADLAARIGLALLLGGIVGAEREVYGHPAGVRTHIMVALGSALFAIISTHGFDTFVTSKPTNVRVDVTRVVSQIVVGIGFLGGGTIIKQGFSIRGLTTAASLWVVAAVGTAAGVGSYFAAVLTTAVVVASLVVLRLPRRWLRVRVASRTDTVVARLRRDADPAGVVSAIQRLQGVEVRALTVREEGGVTVVEFDLRRGADVDLETRLAGIAGHQDVEELDVT